MKRLVGWRALFAAPLLVLVCFAISASGAGAAAPTGTRVVAPKPVLPHGAKNLGPVSPSATVSGAVVLQPRDESALTRFISQVTDRHSALFHHYLTPTTFAAKFGPTPASIAAVEAQLRSQGLAVTNVSRSGLLIDFRGAATKVETTFRTGLARYKLANGSIGQARTGALRVPASIARYVTSVVGLDNTVKAHAEGLRPSKSAAVNRAAAKAGSFVHPAGSPTPCSDASDIAESFGGLTDDQIAHAYGADPLYGAGDTGAGQHVAVFELEPFAMSDVQTFDTCYFGATAAGQMLGRLHVKNVDGGQTAGPGSGESILDIQDVSAFAPGANVDVYEAPNNTFGSLDMYARIVNDDVDNILTTSWGLCEQAVQQGEPGVQQAENLIFEQAAAQGMTVFSAAGDQGSNDCNAFRTTAPVDPILSVDDPSSQPYVVSTGGTTMDDATQPASEHVWNDGAAWGAGGGGISESWPMPTWQATPQVPGGVGTTQNKNQVTAAQNFMGTGFCLSDSPFGGAETACREVPDVSANADEFTGAVTIYIAAFGGWNTIGGTSSAAPMWAGMLADVNASSTCKNNVATANGVGFVNPLLYSVASNPTAYAASFNDITQGNNDPYGDANLFQAGTGYDMASGLGSPQLTSPSGGAGLAFYLCSQAPAATRPTVTNVAPNVGFTSASDVPVTITGTNFFKSGLSNVSGVSVGNVNLPTGSFTVVNNTTITADLPSAALVVPPNDQTDGAGQVQIVVTLNDGETSVVNANTGFTYVDDNGTTSTPTVLGVHSYAGPEAGGNMVDIYGAGFTGATDVTFGGVSVGGGNFTVVHDWLIRAKVPAFVNGTTACDQDGASFGTGETAANDVCQTQVEVTSPGGTSNDSTILPLYEGAINFSSDGVVVPPAGQEGGPAATEYDYLPTPHITSISTSNGPNSLASEEGGSVVTIDGSGFNLAGIDWVNFGAPTQASSQQFFNLVSVTGTEIQIQAPDFPDSLGRDLSLNPATVPVTVQTAAGLSNGTNATYAGIPTVSGVVATAGSTAGTPAGPDTGGTPIDITGSGFANQANLVLFQDVATPFSLGTQFNFNTNSNTDITTRTVPQNPAIVDTQVCTITDCSPPTSANNDSSDVFFLFPPGNPKITSITPDTGPATGGTQVTIHGQNLGCVTDISFGSVQAETFTNQEAFLDCGLTDTVTVTAPASTVVGSVTVSLDTVESVATGAPAAIGHFTYTQPPAQTVTVHKTGNGKGTVTSSPAGISCGSTCSHAFTYGSSVTLKAKASSGSSFGGFTGACTGKSTCSVTANKAQSVTAKFTLKNCVVPKVKGKSLSAAKKALKAHSCSAGKVHHAFSSKVKKGRVVSTKPKAGSHLKHNGKVSLTVSKGKKKK
jgi:hypothetical protein